MRLNDDKIKQDMMNEIVITECPKVFKAVAENILKLLNVTKPPDYNSMTELDKRLTVMYWENFDNLAFYGDGLYSAIKFTTEFEDWYVKQATSPDLISRARRWLAENRYIIIKTSVAEHAQEAGEKWRGAVGR